MTKEIEKLEDLGWDEYLQSQRAAINMADFSVARVMAQYKGAYKVKSPEGEFLAKITGKQIFEATSHEDYPAVGDWVAITELGNGQAQIKSVLPRKSIIKRKFGDRNKIGDKTNLQIIATNIDVAFLVQSVGRDYSLNRFERYLAIVRDTNIEPAIIINKIDLISQEELEAKVLEIKNRLGDIDVILTSIVNNEGIQKLKDYIKKGKTYCFLGSSGVGKSSLINKLLGEDIIKTENISAYSERGKHITTSREMYFLGSGGIVIDNPGVREIGLTDASEGVEALFDEITSLAEKCRYADCTHVHEPGCEVLAALKDGRLEENKYSNYINLKKETQYYEMIDRQKKERGRQFGKFLKNAKKDFRKFGLKDY